MESIINYFNENLVGFCIDAALILIISVASFIILLKKIKKPTVILYPIFYLIAVALFIIFDVKYIAYTTIMGGILIASAELYSANSEFRLHQRVTSNDKKQSPKYITNEDEKNRLIAVLSETAQYFSERKIGAIITIEREQSLNAYIEKAVKLDAVVTTELLKTIFFPNTALHDGAVIIRGNRIVCATAFYTPSDKADIPNELGSRHRAAIGISEDSDAFTLVVSEETGQISTTIGGTITRKLTKEALELSLSQHLVVK